MPKAKRGKTGLRVVSRPGTSQLYIRGTVRGRSIFQSAGTTEPALAEEARVKLEADLYRNSLYGTRPKVTFSTAADLYLKRPGGVSNHTRMAIDRLIIEYGPHITCDQIDQNAIDQAATHLCREGVTAATITRAIVTPTRAVLMFAAERGWCDRPTFRRTKGGGKRTEWFAPQEADALIAGAAAHLRPLLVFLFCTGARMGEAVALDWRDVDLDHARAILRRTKNGDDRIVDLSPRAVKALTDLPEREGRVFLCPDGNPTYEKTKLIPYRLSGENRFGSGGGQVKRSWASAMKAAKIERHLTPHHTRHTWASWHYCVHKDMLRLRQEGGWKTISQCERYAKLVPDGYQKQIVAFWTARGAKSVQSARRNGRFACPA